MAVQQGRQILEPWSTIIQKTEAKQMSTFITLLRFMEHIQIKGPQQYVITT